MVKNKPGPGVKGQNGKGVSCQSDDDIADYSCAPQNISLKYFPCFERESQPFREDKDMEVNEIRYKVVCLHNIQFEKVYV